MDSTGLRTGLEAGLRAAPVRLLLAAALSMPLILGPTFITMHRLDNRRGPAVEAAADPLSDDQAMAQVIGPARQFVGAGPLTDINASYILMSCLNTEEPPYQGAAYLNFEVPTMTETPEFFRRIARVMAARGWTEALPPGRHPGGHTLTNGGVTAVYYRNPDNAGRGVLQLYGECRNVNDHRTDTNGWVDITGRVRN